MKISVIIITKNEEKRIQSAIESVLKALEDYSEYEIILVDSNSTDKTIEIAKRYPIKIIQLRSDWRHSAAAGEYIGYLYSNGDFICFLDGDMIVSPNWFKDSIDYLKKDDVAGVSGKITNIFDNGCVGLIAKRIKFDFDLKEGEVDVLGGPAMFKDSVLRNVGVYHPFLNAGEEAELSYRIRMKGYKLLRLSIPMVNHNAECIPLTKYLYKYHWEYPKAVGSSIRYSFRTNKQITYKRLPIVIQSMILNMYLITGTYLLIKGYLLLMILGYSLFFFVILLIKRRDIGDAIFSILIVHIRSLAIFRGFLEDLPNPEEYPNIPIIIK